MNTASKLILGFCGLMIVGFVATSKYETVPFSGDYMVSERNCTSSKYGSSCSIRLKNINPSKVQNLDFTEKELFESGLPFTKGSVINISGKVSYTKVTDEKNISSGVIIEQVDGKDTKMEAKNPSFFY